MIGFDPLRKSWPWYKASNHVPIGPFVDSRLRDDLMDLAPDYQRGHVWTPTQSSRYIGHLLEGGSSPAFIIHEDWRTSRMEMVDGQQRSRALLGWFDGQIGAELTDGRMVWYPDADATEQRMIRMNCTVTECVGTWTRAERLRLYLRLNRGGTVHTDTEIERVRALLAEASDR